MLLTGLPAAGKSTLAAAVRDILARSVSRPISLLDGDALRREMSSDLGYSREDREEHLRRVGRHAADITRTGGVAVCSVIAPYDSGRQAARRLVEPSGTFILVYISTPLAVCAARDPKGLYAKARSGALPYFTGVSDPYEAPSDAELTVDMGTIAPAEAGQLVVDYLRSRGLVT